MPESPLWRSIEDELPPPTAHAVPEPAVGVLLAVLVVVLMWRRR